MKRGLLIQSLNARTIAREGTPVTLNTGVTLSAVIHHGDHELLHTVTADDDQEKKVVVFVFDGTAWGKIAEGMTLTVGGAVSVPVPNAQPVTVDMGRPFRVAAPLHPVWLGDVVTELAVAAYPDL